MKTVPGKDTGYDDPEDGNIKETVASSKAVNGVTRAIIVKASPGKFERRITVKAAVKGKVMEGGERMKGAMYTNTHNHTTANVCANNTTMVTTLVEQRQRHQSNVGFG